MVFCQSNNTDPSFFDHISLFTDCGQRKYRRQNEREDHRVDHI